MDNRTPAQNVKANDPAPLQLGRGQLVSEEVALPSASTSLLGVEQVFAQGRFSGLVGLLGLALLLLLQQSLHPELSFQQPWLMLAAGGQLLGVMAWLLSRRLLVTRSRLPFWRLLLTLAGLTAISGWGLGLAGFVLQAAGSALLLPITITLAAAFAWVLVMAIWPPGLWLAWLWLAAVLGYSLQNHLADLEPWPLLAISVGLVAVSLLISRLTDRYIKLLLVERRTRRDFSSLKNDLQQQEARVLSERQQRHQVEQALSRASDAANSANQAKSEFLATMSHEIRTPLNGILPILDILKDTPLNQEQLQYVTTAYNSSRHLLRIINDVLDYSKAESGKLELENIELDIRDLLDAVVQLMGKSAELRGLRLVSQVADNVPHSVRGDPIRLQQVLTNLINNAIKFTERGEVRVEIAKRRSSRKEVELLFSVTDSGVGMDRETQRRLFRVFSQADASTTRKHGGTGLGLAICKQLVTLMGGRIGVHSSPGAGSTFWFTLLMRKSAHDVPASRKDLRGVRILSLVDDPSESARISGYLRQWGVEENSYDSLLVALKDLESMAGLGQRSMHDLILVSASQNPGAGLAFVEELRSNPALQTAQVVFVLGSSSSELKLKPEPGLHLIQGPLQPQVLKRQLERLLDVEGERLGVDPQADPGKTLGDLASDQSISFVHEQTEQQAVQPAFHDARVLLVEDNPVNLNVARKLLSRLGIDCDVAHHGKEALTMLGKGRFDLVIMDCQMPIMDGYQATQRWRELEQSNAWPHLPIVAITANAMGDDRERCLRAGMDDYLAKPVSLERMRTVMQRWLPDDWASQEEIKGHAGQAAPQLQAVVDMALFDELREVMEGDLDALIQSYLDSAPGLLTQLEQAVLGQDIEAMVLPAHSLKSSSANMGAMRASECAKQVEHAARGGDLATATEQAARLRLEFEAAAVELRRLISP